MHTAYRYRCPYVQHAGAAYVLLHSRADYAVCSTFAEDLLEIWSGFEV
jgi:hypothetical protein